ncbi:MAG: CRISPR-associated helicase Cas3' [Planctomycetaceae bacterium]|nr:CRISPR-associated helicase Cas3' [Planctomycetaceae bacterium]
MDKNRLWAKSRPWEDDTEVPSVEEHSRAVCAAAMTVWEATADDWSRALGNRVSDLSDLQPILRVSALLHDIGKANNAFQDMVKRNKPDYRQPVRHEILSAVIWSRTFTEKWCSASVWLRESLGEDFWPVLWAIGGHHLQLRQPRFGETEDPILRTERVGNREISFYLEHPEVASLLGDAGKILRDAGRSVPDSIPRLSQCVFTTDEDDEERYIGMPVNSFVREAQQAWRSLRRNNRMANRAAILKALLIAADVAGSALHVDDLDAMIRSSLTARIDPSSLEGVVGGLKRRKFQEKVLEVAKATAGSADQSVMIIEAGCGNGKTSAAYLWAQHRALNRKLFFCYPTTGTTSAGYDEYLSDQKGLSHDLLHSRASVDRLIMQESPDEKTTDIAYKAEALRAWGKQVVACTCDQVLGLIQNNRRPLFASPAIACGAFVFDEIHSYDERLFRELLRFLAFFPSAPTLLMSASIPPARQQALKDVLGERFGAPILGDESLETIPRYVLERREGPEICWEDVAKAVALHQKVLWVCNTVDDAIKVFGEAAQRFPEVRRMLYHSRFRYGGDRQGKCTGWPVIGRVERQDEVIAEFKYTNEKKKLRLNPGAAIAVTTQVCEMSLDIDADLLVTANCPFPSLIQRLGRLHRFAYVNDPKGKKPRRCLVYPFSGRPYHVGDAPAQIETTNRYLDEHSSTPVSQRDLANTLQGMQGDSEAYRERIYSAWLDGGWQSESLPTREGSNSITVLRAEDVEQTEKALGKPRRKLKSAEVIPMTIPMLIERGFKFEDQRVAGYPVAPAGSIVYGEAEGASWAD